MNVLHFSKFTFHRTVRFLLSLSLLLACGLAFAGPDSILPNNDVKGKVVEWNWNQLMVTNLTKNVTAKFPNLQFEGVIVNRPDYMQKLQSALSAETDVPDIILAEMSWRGRLLDLDILENLEAPPYNFNRSELLPAVIPLLENQKGQIAGLDQQFCPAGFAYRRDLMKQYFGIEEPADVAKLIADWDSFITTGKTLAKKSNGKVFMMASIQDLLTCIRGQNAQEYIKGGVIDATTRFKNVFELATRIRDSGPILDNYEPDTPAWNASFAKGDVMFYNLSSWAAKTYIAGNDKENGKGRWGLVRSPGPHGFTLGGTLVGIYKGSKNKEAAWAYLKYIYGTKEGAGTMYSDMGYIYSFKAFYVGPDSPIKKPGHYDDYFKGQNLGQYYYNVIAPTVTTERQTVYATAVDEAFSVVMPLYLRDKTMNAKAGLDKFIEDLKLRVPDATVK